MSDLIPRITWLKQVSEDQTADSLRTFHRLQVRQESDIHKARYRKENSNGDRLAEVADPVPTAEGLLGEIIFLGGKQNELHAVCRKGYAVSAYGR